MSTTTSRNSHTCEEKTNGKYGLSTNAENRSIAPGLCVNRMYRSTGAVSRTASAWEPKVATNRATTYFDIATPRCAIADIGSLLVIRLYEMNATAKKSNIRMTIASIAVP